MGDDEVVALELDVDAGLEATDDDRPDPQRQREERDPGREQVPTLLAHGRTVAGGPGPARAGFPATPGRDATAGRRPSGRSTLGSSRRPNGGEDRMTTALETIGLGKRYGLRRWALRDLDITVEQGTITALVGPNGSGKSTLLKAWVGFERPTAGRLRIHGVDPVRQRGRAIALTGYVPQQPSLYRELTIADHLAFAATHRPGFDASLARRLPRRPLDPARFPRRPAVWGTAGAGGAGARAGDAGAGPAPRRAAREPRPAGAARVPAGPRRRGAGERRDGAALVARDHRHRAGLRPPDRAGRRAVAARGVDRRRDRRPLRRGRRRGRPARRGGDRDVPVADRRAARRCCAGGAVARPRSRRS